MADEDAIEAELPLDTAGARLLRAREAAGLSLKQVSETTKISERYLAALEQGNFGALPARTYATGFGRSYAKAVGADAVAIVAAVRAELASVEPEAPRRAVQTFEPGDPSRLPSSTLAWIAGLLALVLAIAALIWWRSGTSNELPSLLPDETPSAAASTASGAPAPAAIGGAVVFTALAPDIWVKFYDSSGTQLLQKPLAQGETYTVPADVPQVLLWTAHPEALAITVGGQPVAKLSEEQQMMKDVPVTAAALLGRPAPGAVSAPAAAPPITLAPNEPRVRQRDRPAAAPRQVRPVEAAPATASPVIEAVPAPVPAAAQGPAPSAT